MERSQDRLGINHALVVGVLLISQALQKDEITLVTNERLCSLGCVRRDNQNASDRLAASGKGNTEISAPFTPTFPGPFLTGVQADGVWGCGQRSSHA